MIKTVLDLQRFLNARTGAGLEEDGKRGPKTRAAIIAGFTNRDATQITTTQVQMIADRLGASLRQVQAVAKVESGGGSHNEQGQPKALYERHYAWRRLRIKIPFLSDPAPGGYTLDADRDGLNDSWEKLADMAMRNPVVAFESASFGMFQIMGAHWKTLGYPGPVEMVWTLRDHESAHYDMLARFIIHNGLLPHLRRLSTNPADCVEFARRYNGPAFAKNAYHQKLAAAMR